MLYYIWLSGATKHLHRSLHGTTAHPHKMENRISCEIEGCDTDFARMADMRRHLVEVHGSPKHCPEPDCSWRGAKRGERLEDHKMKAHPEIYNEVVLNVPEGFGTPSPSILAQIPQAEGSMGGATMNSYFSFNEGSVHMGQYSNDSLPEPDSRISVASSSPGVLGEGNELPAAQWELPLPQNQSVFGETVPQYQIHPLPPGDVHPAHLHPPLIYPEAADQVDDVNEGVDRLGRQGRAPTDGNAGNDGSQYSWL